VTSLSLDRIAVIVPARSEQETVAKVVHGICRALSNSICEFRIVVVDDQSDDDTCARAEATGAEVVHTSVYDSGLAAAFRVGVESGLELGATMLMTVDADGQYEPAELHLLLEACRRGADLAIGNRLHGRPGHMSVGRYVGNKAYSRVLTLGLGLGPLDCQSGFRAFCSSVARRCPVESEFTYTQEQTLLALRSGVVVRSVDVSFGKREFGSSRLVRSKADYLLRTIGPSVRARFGATGMDDLRAGTGMTTISACEPY
jgi:glycosyltransferase involved in cell wall biosynthesis